MSAGLAVAASGAAPASARSDRSGPEEPLSRRGRLALLVLLLAVALAYARTFAAPFVFDDRRLVSENPLVRDLAVYFVPGHLDAVSAHPAQRDAVETRWLSMLTFALDYRLHGADPRGFHATNLLVHLLAAAALFDLVRRTLRLPALARSAVAGRAEEVALIVAALFALHPLQTQAVTYVVQRMASLAGALCLVALWAHLRARTSAAAKARFGFAVLTVAALAGAMLSKQNAFTFPIVLALYDRLLLPRDGGRRRLALIALPLLTMLIVPARQLAQPDSRGGAFEGAADRSDSETRLTHADYLRTQTRVVATYLRLLALPVGQNLDWDVEPSRSWTELRVVAPGLFLASLAALGGWLIATNGRRDPAWSLVGFGIVWFFVTLAVESGLVPIRDLMFEHRLYLPSVGAILAAVVALLLLVPPRAWRLAVATLAVAGLLLGCATFARNEVWRDELRLWRDAMAKSPGKVRPMSNAATALVERGRFGDAEALFRKVLERDPENRAALRSMGRLSRVRGASGEAEGFYRRALALSGSDWISLLNLGDLAVERGDRSAAKELYERAAASEPGSRLSRARLARLGGESPGEGSLPVPLDASAD